MKVAKRFSLILGLFPWLSTAVLAAQIGGSGVAGNGANKTDFDVVVTSTTLLNITDSTLKVGDTSIGAGVITNNFTNKVTITWNTPIPRLTAVSWSFTGDEAGTRNVYSWTVSFTPPASPTDLPSLGWNVTPEGDVFLTNGYATPIAFSGLVFQQTGGMDVNSLINLVQGPITGIPGSISTGVVPGNGQLFAGSVLLPPGRFLTAQYTSSFTDTSFSPLTMTGGLGHQAAIPEPATLLLVSGGLLALRGARNRTSRQQSTGAV